MHPNRTLICALTISILAARVVPTRGVETHGALQPAAASLPDRLSDAEFRTLLTEMSEPDGFFVLAENYSSNEIEIATLFTMLQAAKPAGDVFVGVGPEQNFSYIAALRPRMAFICDIRHQAALQHLMFKAVFELSRDRADFISRLFARPRPAGLDAETPIGKMWEAFEAVPANPAAAAETVARVDAQLTKTHGLVLTATELAQLRHVEDAFIQIGPSITTRGTTDQGRQGMTPLGFADMTGRSVDATGQVRTFLSSEENYRFVKSMQERNLIVPVTGDFAGPKALRAIGRYIESHAATVSAFYVSNVEDYLFQNGRAPDFYANAGTLPVSATSVFVRPYAMRPGRGGSGPGVPLCPMAAYLRAVADGRARTPTDMFQCTR